MTKFVFREGLLLYVLVIVGVLQIRGISFAAVLLFGVPPLFAAALSQSPDSMRPTRIAAGAFLWLVAIGTIVARIPSLFPNLGGFDQRLTPVQDRTVSWYFAVYLTFFFYILPVAGFLSARARKARGETPTIAPWIMGFACFVSVVLLIGLPMIFERFWPVF